MRDSRSPGSVHRRYPDGKVVGALHPESVESVVTALAGSGIDSGQIEVITTENVADLLAPLDRKGLAGFVGRFLLRSGDDLDDLEAARRELSMGHTIIFVSVTGIDVRHQVRDILRAHGGHKIRYFSHWTITRMD